VFCTLQRGHIRLHHVTEAFCFPERRVERYQPLIFRGGVRFSGRRARPRRRTTSPPSFSLFCNSTTPAFSPPNRFLAVASGSGDWILLPTNIVSDLAGFFRQLRIVCRCERPSLDRTRLSIAQTTQRAQACLPSPWLLARGRPDNQHQHPAAHNVSSAPHVASPTSARDICQSLQLLVRFTVSLFASQYCQLQHSSSSCC